MDTLYIDEIILALICMSPFIAVCAVAIWMLVRDSKVEVSE